LGDTTGLSNTRVSEIDGPLGDGRAYGTFENDPFGLQSGIVLSTGKVEDLVGPNSDDGGIAPPSSFILEFTQLGDPSSESDIFVADLSGLPIDIQSIEISDSNSRSGGGTGAVSGFDLDAIKLSTILLDANDISDINDNQVLPSENVFDFSPAGTIFNPGAQRGDNPAPDLQGSINGFVDNAVATLDKFDGTSSARDGSVSLGDGGKVGFNLTEPIASSDQPLYLYISEAGSLSADEQLEGVITVSNQRIGEDVDPSTDFLSDGEPDVVTFTVEFDADTKVRDTLYFRYVFGSEEFVEYAGGADNDSFEFRLNGRNLATLSDGSTVTINQLARDPDLANDSETDPYHPDFIYNPAIDNSSGAGPASDLIKLDGYTRPLLYEAPLQEGYNKFEIILQDGIDSDGSLDSAVFIQRESFGTVEPPLVPNNGGDGGEPSPLPELLDLTGTDTDVIINFTLQREAAFDNLLQFYETDANGQIDGLLPGESGYEEAVAANLLAPELFVANRETKTVEVVFSGGKYYAPALLIRGDLNDLATIHDTALGNVRVQRNEDIWRFEDLTDNDFNDLVLGIQSIGVTLP
jgi:hypothetical protein